MRKRALGLFLSVVMAASVMAGCSGGQKEAAKEGAPKAESSQGSEAAGEAAGSRGAEAEISWPENPVQIIVGANAGGGIDTAARLIAKYMEHCFHILKNIKLLEYFTTIMP